MRIDWKINITIMELECFSNRSDFQTTGDLHVYIQENRVWNSVLNETVI